MRKNTFKKLQHYVKKMPKKHKKADGQVNKMLNCGKFCAAGGRAI